MHYYIVICGVFGFTTFLTLSLKQRYFRKQCLERKTSVAIFSTNLGEIFLILRKIQEDFFV